MNLPVLGDAIFGYCDVIRALEKLTKTTIAAHQSVGISGIRIPVEWTIAKIRSEWGLTTNFTKLKLFQTRPKSIIVTAILLSNFKTCFAQLSTSTCYPNFQSIHSI